MELPGMLFGRIARPPSYAARLAAIEVSEVQALPGVVTVVRDGSFVGVIAEREEQAIRAVRRLARSAEWRSAERLPADSPVDKYLMAQDAVDAVISTKSDPAAVQRRVKSLSATYTRPYIAHASIGLDT
jgi:hypothetical protein